MHLPGLLVVVDKLASWIEPIQGDGVYLVWHSSLALTY